MGASALRGNCTVIRTVDVQYLGMSCEDCDVKFTLLRRRKSCCDCSYDFCASCVSRLRGLEKRYQCYRCRIFSSMPYDRNAITGLKIRHLRWFLSTNAVPMNGCKEKSELVDLVMNHLRYKESAAQYPQNFERRTVGPEYLPCDSPLGSSESSPVRTVGRSHYPGPSGSALVGTRVQITTAESVLSEELHDTSETSSSNTDLYAREGASPSREQVQIDESISIPSDDIDVQQVEDDTSQQEKDIDLRSRQNMEKRKLAAVSVHDLESVEHIDSLSVMQLKLILTRNFINYKGCCEKQELQEKVRNLWAQKQKVRDVDSIPDENLCRICMEAAIDSVLLECGHVVTCTECGKRLNECPICRQYIVRVVHIFKA